LLSARPKDNDELLEALEVVTTRIQMPVVAMTGSPGEALVDRAVRLESECLVKLFSYDDLNEHLEKAGAVDVGESDS
jgi:AmiR/NasT family two-component response regulator